MLKDFKAFVMRGNVLDLAVAVIIGGAFGKIVSSLVNDVIMPPIGRILGKMDFSSFFLNLSGVHYNSLKEAKDAGAAVISYGAFVNVLLDFLIVAFVIFLMVKVVNRLYKKEEKAPAPSTRECPHCISRISARATRCPHCTSTL